MTVSGVNFAEGDLAPGVLAVRYSRTGKKQAIGAEDERVQAFGVKAWGPTRAVSADFDRDGYADVAVRQARWDVGGALAVFYGSTKGLGRRTSYLRLDSAPIEGERADIVSGDFDGDGRPEVATVLASPGGAQAVRVAVVRFGSGAPKSTALTLSPLPYDGARLAAGDFDGDGRADLAIGTVGGESWNAWETDAGPMLLAPGGEGGLGQAVKAGTGGGYDMVAGDVTGDGRADLVVSGPSGKKGQVRVLRGTRKGLAALVGFTKETKGVPGATPPGLAGRFGASLALGDLNRDGRADIAVGDTGDGYRNRGSVTVVRGAPGGFTVKGARRFTEDSKGVPTASRSDENFGVAVSLLDVSGDKVPDLLVGASGEKEQLIFSFRTVKGVPGTPVRAYGSRSLGVLVPGSSGYLRGDFGRHRSHRGARPRRPRPGLVRAQGPGQGVGPRR